jgi:hypothetical protein
VPEAREFAARIAVKSDMDARTQKRPFIKTAERMPADLRVLTMITGVVAAGSMTGMSYVAIVYGLPLLVAGILEPYLDDYGRAVVGVAAVILNVIALPFLAIYSVMGIAVMARGNVPADLAMLLVLIVPVGLACLLYFDWQFIRWNLRVEKGRI